MGFYYILGGGAHLKREEITIAALLRDAGYDTSFVGKWHLTDFDSPEKGQPDPGDHGFDHWFGTVVNAFDGPENPGQFYRNGEPSGPLHGWYCDLIVGEAIDWLRSREQPDKPFFLFVSSHEPHAPIAPPSRFADAYDDEETARLAEAIQYGGVARPEDRDIEDNKRFYYGTVRSTRRGATTTPAGCRTYGTPSRCTPTTSALPVWSETPSRRAHRCASTGGRAWSSRPPTSGPRSRWWSSRPARASASLSAPRPRPPSLVSGRALRHALGTSSEGGVAPGEGFPIFETDFGRLGIQICWDAVYDDGWEALARQGAEIVAFPSAAPHVARPSSFALRGDYWVVSSTPLNNASIFNPIGMVHARITEGSVLVREIDLSHAVVHWAPGLDEGRGLTARFGDRVGYVYYESEATGVFWSNDPETPIADMLAEAGFMEMGPYVERNRRAQDAARGGPVGGPE